MKIKVQPIDIKCVRVFLTRRTGGGKVARVTIPTEIIKRYNIQDKEGILIAYLCKEGQQIPEE